MTSNDRPLPPAGWYPDPRQRGQERWWDGASWSDDTREPQPGPTTLPADWRVEPPRTGATEAPRPGATAPDATGPARLDPFQPVGFGAVPGPGAPLQPGEHLREADPDRPATFGQRFLATVIDSVLVQLVSSLLWLPVLMRHEDLVAKLQTGRLDEATLAEFVAGVPMVDQLALAGIVFAVWFAYGGVMLSWRQASLGQLATGVRVVGVDGGRLSRQRAWGRSFAWALLVTVGQVPLLMWVVVVSCLRMLWHPSRQTFHDAVMGTRAVPRR